MNPAHIDEWLLSCLRVDPDQAGVAESQAPSEAEWEELVQQADRHRITPYLYHHLQTVHPNLPIPPGIVGKLRQGHLDNAARNLRLFGHLGKILQLLRDNDVPAIALKGAYLAERVYAHRALRYLGDLDLLVRKSDLMKVDALLLEMGCHPTLPNRIVGPDNNEFVYEMPRRDLSVEIHWSILPPQFPFPIDTDGQWRRARPAVLAGVETLAFCPEDLLLHLCLHAGCTHGYEPGLRLFCDIREILRCHEADLDWALVRRLIREWGIGKSVFLTLHLARELMGAQVPEGVMDELRPVDFDERFVALAKDQIFGRKVRTGQPLSMWPAVAQFWGAGRLRDKVKLFWKGLFLPRESMARLYPATAGSWKMNFYYAVRLRDLLRTYGRDAIRWLRRDKDMQAVAQEGRDLTTLKEWLLSP
jgi:hypothetical protein